MAQFHSDRGLVHFLVLRTSFFMESLYVFVYVVIYNVWHCITVLYIYTPTHTMSLTLALALWTRLSAQC